MATSLKKLCARLFAMLWPGKNRAQQSSSEPSGSATVQATPKRRSRFLEVPEITHHKRPNRGKRKNKHRRKTPNTARQKRNPPSLWYRSKVELKQTKPGIPNLHLIDPEGNRYFLYEDWELEELAKEQGIRR